MCRTTRLEGTDTGIHRQIQARVREIANTQDSRERVMLCKEIDELRSVMQDVASLLILQVLTPSGNSVDGPASLGVSI